ncbi:hypothetical protein ACWD4L_45285 [Streptomyces sp. NPDC002596]
MGDVRRPRGRRDPSHRAEGDRPRHAARRLPDRSLEQQRSGFRLPGCPETTPVADVDPLADAWSTTVPAVASAPPPADVPAAVDLDDAVVGLRKAHQDHPPELTLAALRWARANDPDFPKTRGERGAEHLYRVGDLKRWARNRPRAVVGTTDLT